jgi:hypothetical protein
MNTELMHIVIDDIAIAIDYTGTPIICDVVQQNDVEYVDWDSAQPIDWLDITPNRYQVYKECVDFLHQFIHQEVYIK